MKKTALFFFLLVVACLFSAFNVKSKQSFFEFLKKDFTPVSGFIINQKGDEFTLDVGRLNGVKPGDTFTILKQGEKIVDKQTGKRLGFKFIPIGVVQVTSVEDAFSKAILLFQNETVPIPVKVKRFFKEKVLIAGKNQNLVQSLKDFLEKNFKGVKVKVIKGEMFSNLSPSYLKKQKIALVFVFKNGLLKIYNTEKKLVRVYSLSKKKLVFSYEDILERGLTLAPIPVKEFQGGMLKTRFFKKDGQVFAVYTWEGAIYITRLKDGKNVFFLKPEGKVFDIKTDSNGVLVTLERDNSTSLLLIRFNEKEDTFKKIYEENENANATLGAKVEAWGKDTTVDFDSKGYLEVTVNGTTLWKSPYPIEEKVFPGNFYFVKPVPFKWENQWFVVVAEVNFPLSPVIDQMECIPLDSAYSRLLILGKGNIGFFLKPLTKAVDGVITGISLIENTLYFSVIKGSFPCQVKTVIFKVSF